MSKPVTDNPDLARLLPSWQVHLEAEHKSPMTVKSYLGGVTAFLRWCGDNGVAPYLDRATVRAYMSHLLGSGASPATAKARHTALRRYSAWLVDEGETDRDDLLGLKAPRLDVKHTPRLTDDQLAALIKACRGRDFRDRRDEAVIRLMAETGMRAGEVIAMTTADVDITRGAAVIRRGKGAKGRIVPFGPVTGRSIDRYMRLRRLHTLADGPALWLGDRGGTLGYYGLWKALRGRAAIAGVADFHPHLLRHTAAQRWLDAGGSEGGLMAVSGWTRREMIDRYTRATSEARAAEEARRLGLGDI